ncbi:uncharacterized protein DDB_G0271670-like [Neocloeon triangulifer]|uniref:uncharacterized protein DDB_G0271670-like n=1 Tax=Neocloeon triangulifer TaxID=2078957 RepID=UPI00286F65BA|nr:uncharacterized protein DDB_G0271670-like [Neocloeon triangulifer]
MRRLLVFAAVVCALHAEAERVLDDISSSSVIDPIEMYRNERKNGNKAKALFLALTVLKRLQRNRLDDLDHQNNAGNADRFGLEWNKRMGTTGKINNGKQEADGIKINFRQVGEERKPQDDLTDWMMRMASKSIDESDSRSVETVKHTKGLGLQKDDDLKFTAVDFKDNFSDWPATFKSSEEKVDKEVKTHEQTKVISDAALRSLVYQGQKSRRPSRPGFSSKEDRWINPRYKSPDAKMPKFTPRALERKFKEGREHCDASSDSSSSSEKSDSRFSKWDRLLAALDRSDSSSSSSDRRSSSSDSRSSSSSDSSSSSSDKRSSYLDRSCSCRDKRISSSESSSSSSDSSFSSLDRDSSSSDSSSSSSDSDSSSSSLISVRSMSSKSLSRFFDSDSFDSSEPSMSLWPSGSSSSSSSSASSSSSDSSSRSHSKTKKKPLCSFCQKMFRKKKGPKKSSKSSSGSSSSSSSGKSILKHYPFLRKLF